IQEGRWPLLFPEGTRIAPGKKGRYKPGGVRLSIHTNTPIIPIAHNAGELWPRRAWIKKPGTITLSIGAPISQHGLTVSELNRQVEDWIENEMRRLNPERYPTS